MSTFFYIQAIFLSFIQCQDTRSVYLPFPNWKGLQPSAAFGTIFKGLLCLISAAGALLMGSERSLHPESPPSALLNQRQIRGSNVHLPAMQYSFPLLRVQLIQRTAAGHFHIEPSVPLKQRDEEKAEVHIGHKNLITSIASTAGAYNCLYIVQKLLPLADSSYEYQKPFSPFSHRECLKRHTKRPLGHPYKAATP